jgi:hypothetical protein
MGCRHHDLIVILGAWHVRGGGVQDALRGGTTPGLFPQLPRSHRWLALTANCQNSLGVAVCTFNSPCVAAPKVGSFVDDFCLEEQFQ